MKAAGFDSQSGLARASGIPQPTINRILKGVGRKGPEAHTLVQLAQTCNVSFEWLHEGVGPMERMPRAASTGSVPGARRVVVADDDSAEFVQVQKVKLCLSAGITGFQTEPDARDGQTISVPRQWLERNRYIPEHLIAVKVKGSSMEPALYEDDIVIINTADTNPVDGCVYAVNYEGEAVVKRMERDAGQWWLASDNKDPKYGRKSCRGNECLIVGRVVRKESDMI